VKFLGAFEKLRKRLVASSGLSVCMAELGTHFTDFHDILYSKVFKKSVEKI